jgi:gamma-glutamyltranspeptidase/glutathione hydrolase
VAGALGRLPPISGLVPAERAVALARALACDERNGHTTTLAVVDRGGNACVVTHSLGLGSGDFLPGLDVHLNSMLGETELLVRPMSAGERMPSMMAPTVAVDATGLVLAAGSAGGSRLRSALVQVLAGILDEELLPEDAVARPRLHPAGRLLHLEAGLGESVAPALEACGFEVREWPELHHYFGGASVVARSGAAADPRRDGLALTARPA